MVGREPAQRVFQTAHGDDVYKRTDTHSQDWHDDRALERLLLANTYVADHRPLHRGSRARDRLQIASTWRREPRTPRMDERAVARRVPRVPEDVDDDRTASPGSVQMFKSEQRSLSVRSSITVSDGASTPGDTRVVAEPTAGIER